MRLVERQKLKLDDRVFAILPLQTHEERGARADPRLHEIRMHHCLQHTAGWDRDKSWDPMSAQGAKEVLTTTTGAASARFLAVAAHRATPPNTCSHVLRPTAFVSASSL
jgi:N-acyl-D-amino-acid deacylase